MTFKVERGLIFISSPCMVRRSIYMATSYLGSRNSHFLTYHHKCKPPDFAALCCCFCFSRMGLEFFSNTHSRLILVKNGRWILGKSISKPSVKWSDGSVMLGACWALKKSFKILLEATVNITSFFFNVKTWWPAQKNWKYVFISCFTGIMILSKWTNQDGNDSLNTVTSHNDVTPHN